MRVVAIVLLLTTAAAAGGEPTTAAQRDETDRLESDATAALNSPTISFADKAALADRLELVMNRGTSAEQRGRMALLWLRMTRTILARLHEVDSSQEPYRAWLAKRERLAVYSEPGGEWILNPDTAWTIHDAHRASAAADEIAWLIVQNGYPGECEGYVPCYANVYNWLDGEYLRRHPQGAHASEAVAQVLETLDTIEKDLTRPSPNYEIDFSDCGDLRKGLLPLRQAVSNAAAERRSDTIAVIDRLASRCKEP